MLCEYIRTLYPNSQKAISNNSSSFFICSYKYCGKRPYLNREAGIYLDKNETFTVKGNNLPLVVGIKLDIKGQWKKDKRGQPVLCMTSFTEVVDDTKMGILNYLSCGAIKGIGPKTAKAIYGTFGKDTIEILDKNPEKLLTVPGIKKKKLEQIMESYIAYKGPRAAIALLSPMGFSQKQAVNVYNRFGPKIEEVVKENPYDLCVVDGLNFVFLDSIFASPENSCSEKRIKAALLYVLQLFEGTAEGPSISKTSGNTCMPISGWLEFTRKLLKNNSISASLIYNCAKALMSDKTVIPFKQGENIYVSTYEAATAEKDIARSVSLLLHYAQYKKIDVKEEIDKMEDEVGFQLAPEQNEAVAKSLENNFTIITGGPGTGKSATRSVVK